jgi:hypothetical protein
MRKLKISKPIKNLSQKAGAEIIGRISMALSTQDKIAADAVAKKKVLLVNSYNDGVLLYIVKYTKLYKREAEVLRGCICDVLRDVQSN